MLLTETVTLEGAFVRLEPLNLDHIEALAAASAEITENLWYAMVPKPEQMEQDVLSRLAMRDAGTMNPFVVRELATDTVVGATALYGLNLDYPRAELGYTWYSPRVRGTAVNPESKKLLLEHAFERCEVIAIQFMTHFHNTRSRAAIAKLGAKQDGILRNHRRGPDGIMRDTVVFSILPHEWAAVRTGLDVRLANFSAQATP